MEFTKYPSIEHFRHLIIKLKKENISNHILHFTGTVKLHGTHADICYQNGNINIQSRNRILTEKDDNIGCFSFLKNKLSFIENISKNPDDLIMISGEFCGKGIQRGVGISDLDKFFVIFDISINGIWMNMLDFKDIYDIDKRIYNIMQFKKYDFFIEMDKLQDDDYVNELQNNLQKNAEDIGLECPVANFFGIKGEGEGIVYKCVDYLDKSELWFKSKCLKHGVSPEKMDKIIKEQADVSEYMTESRLLQGIDYLREFNYPINKSSISIFIKWIVVDIYKEEPELKKNGKLTSINTKSKNWFLNYIGTYYK